MKSASPATFYTTTSTDPTTSADPTTTDARYASTASNTAAPACPSTASLPVCRPDHLAFLHNGQIGDVNRNPVSTSIHSVGGEIGNDLCSCGRVEAARL